MEMTLDPPLEGTDGKSRRKKSTRKKSESTEQLDESSSKHHHHHRSHRHRDETPEERAARKLRKSQEASLKAVDQNGEVDLAASKSRRKSKRASKDPTVSTIPAGHPAGEDDGTEEQKHRRRKHRSHPEGSTSELQSPKHRHSHHGHNHKRKSSSASKSKHREERDRDEKRSERHSKSEKAVIFEYPDYEQQPDIISSTGARLFPRIEPQNIPDSEMRDVQHSYGRDRNMAWMDYGASGRADDRRDTSPNQRIGRIFSERANPIHIPEGPKPPITPPRSRHTMGDGDSNRNLPTLGVSSPLTPLLSPLQRRAAVRRKRPNELDTVGMGIHRLDFDDSDEQQAGGGFGSTLQPNIWSDDGGNISPQLSPYMSTEFPTFRNSKSPDPRPETRATSDAKPLPLSCRLPLVIPEAKSSPFGGPLQIPSVPSRPAVLGNPFNPVYPGNSTNARNDSGNHEFGNFPVLQVSNPTSTAPYSKPSTSPAPPPLPPKPYGLKPAPPLSPPQHDDHQSNHHHHHHHHHHHKPPSNSPQNPIVSPSSFGAPIPIAGTATPGESKFGGSFARKVEHLEAKAMNKLHKVRDSTRHSSR